MTLDPQVRAMLDQLAALKLPSFETLPLPLLRQGSGMQLMPTSNEEVFSVDDHTIPGPDGDVPIRIYKPDGNGPHPALVFYHGGGFVLGSIATHDALCRSLTNRANCVVISVEYRLAPEHKFPAGLEDSYAATQWVFNHAEELSIDPSRIAVGGDSAGGNFAAVISNLVNERGHHKPIFQLLLYPTVDLHNQSESRRAFAEGYFLTEKQMRFFGESYLNTPEDAKNPMVSPALIEDMSQLPPALVITAGYDPLRDEGEAYAKRLQAAGVDVKYTNYPGMIHGFMTFANYFDVANDAIQEAADALRVAFSK